MIGRQLAHDAMDGVWQEYTPVLTGQGSNPTLGTGSEQTGLWCRIGDTVHVIGAIMYGTSGTAAGSGEARITLPIAAKATRGDSGFPIGTVSITDDSFGNVGPDQVWTAGNDTINCRIQTGSGYRDVDTYSDASDGYFFQLTYPAA